ncbi:MarR family transcriptional regulator [Pseudooceanicola sp. C21-150M6]|uniref:MarR family transcriptional regulator n=1 Tax=Pseudooceanicola sp. C21-150M6 TaxID=3434355 RepID=UPI003D7F7D19
MTDDPDIAHQAEALRLAISGFVRRTRAGADAPSGARAETLHLLDTAGPQSIATLARARHVKHQSMRLVLRELEQDGIVSATPDPADARGRLYQLTAMGRAHLEGLRDRKRNWITTRLSEDLTAAERAELARLITLLDRLDDKTN